MSLSQRARRVYELPEELLRLIEATLLECSRTNIKACRSFLLRSFLNSSLKVDRLGKFLTALSRQITPADHGAIENLPRETLFTARRKRLHILYLLNDVLFHASHHPRKSRWQSFSKGLSPHLVELVYLASAAASNAEDDTMKRVKGIIEIWAEQGYLSKDYVDNKLRTTAEYAEKLASKDPGRGGLDSSVRLRVRHTSNVPQNANPDWHLLPAGNMLPMIKAASTEAVNSRRLRARNLSPGPLSSKTLAEVRDFLQEAKKVQDPNPGDDSPSSWDVSELGDRITKIPGSGEAVSGETYYGWSRAMLMGTRRRLKNGPRKAYKLEVRRTARRSLNYDQRSPRQHIREARPSNSSLDIMRSHERRRSKSPLYGGSTNFRDRSPRNRREGRNTSPSNDEERRAHTFASQTSSASDRQPPRYSSAAPTIDATSQSGYSSFPPHAWVPPPPHASQPFFGQGVPPLPLGPNGMPIPPPPPRGYTGPWPPPPPPIGSQMPFGQMPQLQNFPQVPPPPPSNVNNYTPYGNYSKSNDHTRQWR